MPNQETLIACRACDQVFCDNNSLFDHYMRLHVGSFESSVNGRNFFSGASHITCFTSLPFTDVNSSADRNFGPNSLQRVTPPADLSVGSNYVGPTPLRNFLQLRGPAPTPRSQSLPFSSNFRPPINTSMLPSCPKQSSNSSFRFASQPTGQPSFHFPRSHITRGGTSSLPRTTKISLLKSTGQSEFQNLVADYTKPYIMQLEHPIEETTVVDPNDNFMPDEIDLTLKL
ncbi:uncharacterized protein [Henckelia pumila]|uniref:uncharacterized protein n=1 Tax=Henckelia pumila TaxID=405737 RepID=UPI003C6DF995